MNIAADMSQLIPIPSSWRFPLTLFAAVIVLAVLDFIGAVFAKEWSDRGHHLLLIGGLASFSLLFIVYARILQTAELSDGLFSSSSGSLPWIGSTMA